MTTVNKVGGPPGERGIQGAAHALFPKFLEEKRHVEGTITAEAAKQENSHPATCSADAAKWFPIN